MCGIAGIASPETLSEQPSLLDRMLDTLTHRGPDDRGTYHGGRAWLGARRLSIIDVPGGHQPIQGQSKRYCIAYNGEIYNFAELRVLLEGRGRRFDTNCDTEVVLAMFEEFGPACLQHFIGMFAIAIWDSASSELFLARDRLGVKPLYYTQAGSKLIFGSEIKALLCHPEVKRQANLEAISSYLTFRTVVGTGTVFKGIHQVPPGCYGVFRGGTFALTKYWEVPIVPDKEDRGEEFYLEKVSELFRSAVNYRMISDVPLGAYLSGGLDSSIMVAVMSQLASAPVKTFSVGFGEEGYNEFRYAGVVSDRFKTDHCEIQVSAQEYNELLPEMIRRRDAPLSIPHEIALYLLSRELKKDVTVVLSGEGADELFGGYGRVMRSPMDYKKVSLARKAPFPVRSLLSLSFRNGNRRERLGCRNEVEHFFHVYNWLPFQDKWDLFTDETNRQIRRDEALIQHFYDAFGRADGANPYDKVLYIFEKIHLLNLLERLDMMSMAASVEARVPFVDHRLVEFVSGMPVKYKLRWRSQLHRALAFFVPAERASESLDISKYLLRRYSATLLPREIVDRKKLGFPVPLDTWLKKEMKRAARDILLDKRTLDRGVLRPDKLRAMLDDDPQLDYDFHGKRVWMLMNVELWMREFID